MEPEEPKIDNTNEKPEKKEKKTPCCGFPKIMFIVVTKTVYYARKRPD